MGGGGHEITTKSTAHSKFSRLETYIYVEKITVVPKGCYFSYISSEGFVESALELKLKERRDCAQAEAASFYAALGMGMHLAAFCTLIRYCECFVSINVCWVIMRAK